MKRTRRLGSPVRMPSGFTGFRFPPEVILLAVRWYLRYGLVLPGPRRAPRRAWHRGRPRDHLPVGAAVHAVADRRGPAVLGTLAGDRWFVDETYVKVSGV